MAIYNFSTLLNGSTTAFDPAVDSLSFNNNL
jgi:hypothetical protein